jgi:hypothetical protein
MKIKLTLRKLRINSQGYTPEGYYYGVGEPVYWYSSDCGKYEGELRAASRDQAKHTIRTSIVRERVSFYN